MKVVFEVRGNILIASLEGELDHHAASSIRGEIDTALDNFNGNKLILNLSEVSFMDSSGIGIIMGRYNKLKAMNGTLAITGCTEYIEKILEMSGVFTIIDRYVNLENAVIAIRD